MGTELLTVESISRTGFSNGGELIAETFRVTRMREFLYQRIVELSSRGFCNSPVFLPAHNYLALFYLRQSPRALFPPLVETRAFAVRVARDISIRFWVIWQQSELLTPGENRFQLLRETNVLRCAIYRSSVLCV